MATKRKYTEEEREAARERERKLIKESVEQLRASEGWTSWLKARSKFRVYSLGNQLLIALQGYTLKKNGWIDAEPIRVAGFRKWLDLGYCVRKRPENLPEDQGWAIRIWAHIDASKKQIEEAKKNGEKPPTGYFKLVNVFGDSQVVELPPPATPVPLHPPVVEIEGDDQAHLWVPLFTFGHSIGSVVSLGDTGSAGGYYNPKDKSIVISESASPNARVHTTVHELAHALVRVDKHEDDPKLSYAEEELVVERVTMSVLATIGFDVSAYAVPYNCSWSEDTSMDVIEDHAKLVNRLCDRLEAVICPVVDAQSEAVLIQS
jgi:hypothetical protein